jgi:hypothetical protein
MSLKTNINKIHGDFLNHFDNISILEKSSKEIGNYFELLINEDNKQVKIIIKKSDINNTSFNWQYYSNPDDSNSSLVERFSSVDGIYLDVKDIFQKNRFDSEYIKKING